MKKKLIPIESLQIAENRQKQIDAWKVEHGQVYYFKLGGGKECYLKGPDLTILSYAGVAGSANLMDYNKVILDECWLAGDEEIKTHPGLFLSISQYLEEMVGMVEVEMVKL